MGELEVVHRDEPGGEFGDGDLGFDDIIELALVGLEDAFDQGAADDGAVGVFDDFGDMIGGGDAEAAGNGGSALGADGADAIGDVGDI